MVIKHVPDRKCVVKGCGTVMTKKISIEAGYYIITYYCSKCNKQETYRGDKIGPT